jgi:hypothetical protein
VLSGEFLQPRRGEPGRPTHTTVGLGCSWDLRRRLLLPRSTAGPHFGAAQSARRASHSVRGRAASFRRPAGRDGDAGRRRSLAHGRSAASLAEPSSCASSTDGSVDCNLLRLHGAFMLSSRFLRSRSREREARLPNTLQWGFGLLGLRASKQLPVTALSFTNGTSP